MIVDKGIRIQNIYYMLAYAFQTLRSEAYEKIGSEEFKNTADLLSAIIAKGIAIQIKRGLGKQYNLISESLSTLRGKIDITSSIKTQTMLKKQLFCCYDEFSINTKHNQIIKTTVYILLRSPAVSKNRKRELKKLMVYFSNVDTLNPYTICWNMFFNRNNQSYEMLTNICYLVIKGLLQKDNKGDIKLQKFLDDQRMSRLYEKFILEYYKKHFPELKPCSKEIKWDVIGDEVSLSMLPAMQSDIILTNGENTLIIDAKYYTKSMTTSQFGNKKTFHSHNLYQIFTYVKNKDENKTGNVRGMILYAKTEEEISPNGEFNMSGNNIYVSNLDLSGDFPSVSQQLKDVLKTLN